MDGARTMREMVARLSLWSGRAPWVILGSIGWVGLIWIGTRLATMNPSRAGDDLRLLVDAAARVQAGQPLYGAIQSGGTLQAESLFYSYPPPVAQALVPISGVPFALILVAWGAGAVAGIAVAARLLGQPPRGLVLPTLAVAPYVYPLAVGLLFGNLNVWFPLVIGLLLGALLRPGRGQEAAAGITLAAVSIAKLHPATLGLWLLVRIRRVDGAERPLLAATILAGAAILGLSLAVGGITPWSDYLTFLRSGASTTNLVSSLNIGPASLLAQLVGAGDEQARVIQIGVTAAALVATCGIAWRTEDVLVSLGGAVAASLVVLPVTWFHYPVALVPIALGALGRAKGVERPRTVALIVAAVVAADLAIILPAAVWVAVGLVLWAARSSRHVRMVQAAALRGGREPARG